MKGGKKAAPAAKSKAKVQAEAPVKKTSCAKSTRASKKEGSILSSSEPSAGGEQESSEEE